MSGISLNIKFRGYDKAIRALEENKQVIDKQITDGLQKAANRVYRDATKMSPVDTGRLRASLAIAGLGIIKAIHIGTNVKYASYVHGDGKKKRSRPHWPPINKQLTDWAQRHKIPVGAVAYSISRKGTPLVPFLKDSLDKNERKIQQDLGKALDKALFLIAKNAG